MWRAEDSNSAVRNLSASSSESSTPKETGVQSAGVAEDKGIEERTISASSPKSSTKKETEAQLGSSELNSPSDPCSQQNTSDSSAGTPTESTAASLTDRTTYSDRSGEEWIATSKSSTAPAAYGPARTWPYCEAHA